MTDAPKTVGLVHNGFGGWRLWTADDADDPTVVAVPYLLAAERDRAEALQAQLAAARDKALEDAARMVDCACECREAVLTANTRVERWTACGRDPCGALDAAAIRALIDKPGTKP